MSKTDKKLKTRLNKLDLSKKNITQKHVINNFSKLDMSPTLNAINNFSKLDMSPTLNAINNFSKLDMSPTLNAINNFSKLDMSPTLNAINNFSKLDMSPTLNAINNFSKLDMSPTLNAINNFSKLDMSPTLNAINNFSKLDMSPIINAQIQTVEHFSKLSDLAEATHTLTNSINLDFLDSFSNIVEITKEIRHKIPKDVHNDLSDVIDSYKTNVSQIQEKQIISEKSNTSSIQDSKPQEQQKLTLQNFIIIIELIIILINFFNSLVSDPNQELKNTISNQQSEIDELQKQNNMRDTTIIEMQNMIIDLQSQIQNQNSTSDTSLQ